VEDDFNDLSGMFQDKTGKAKTMASEQIEFMVNRFLGWKLPQDFHPDAGVSFEPEFNKEWNAKQGKPPQRHEPVGTNLLSATQAEAMVRYMLEGVPSLGEEVSAGRIRELWKECGGMLDKKKGRFWIEPEHAADLIRKIISAITSIAYKSQ
jgi:hypothetical protein